MARTKRVVVPGCPMHITHRGNNRSTIFFDDADCHAYHALLQQSRTKYSCAIHAYVFMSNHIHLLATPAGDQGPAQMMHLAGSRYAQYFNNRYGRTGSVWEGRYHSSLVQTSKYFFACSRYIELNPVRALMVDQPERYAWSSYQGNVAGKLNALITPHTLYRNLATNDRDRRSAYRAMFLNSIDPEVVMAIRTGTRRSVVTGDTVFRDHLTRTLQRRIPDAIHGGDRRSQMYQNFTPMVLGSN